MGRDFPVGAVPGDLFYDQDAQTLSVYTGSGWVAAGSPRAQSMPLISRNAASGGLAVAFASNEAFYPASNCADNDYKTFWRSVTVPSAGVPQGVGYDLSGVPAAQRASVLVNWVNQQQDVLPAAPTLLPVNYKIQANAAAGGGAAPGGGWVDLVTVTSNALHGRQHLVNLSGYNWVRLWVTVSAGAAGNDDMQLQMLDLHDAHLGADDGILILGDSITAECTLPFNALSNVTWAGGNLAQLVNASNPSHFPAVQGGGQGATNMAYIVSNFAALTAGFACKYVGVHMGHNDANQPAALSAPTVTTWYNNLLSVIDSIKALNKIPVLAKLLYGNAQASYAANGVTLNAKIEQAFTDRTGCVRGPDLYNFFQANNGLLRDGLHPTYTGTEGSGLLAGLNGYEYLIRGWRDALLAGIY